MNRTLFKRTLVFVLAMVGLVSWPTTLGPSWTRHLPVTRAIEVRADTCASNPQGLHVVATDPKRPHLVSAGGVTTFVVGLYNPSAQTIAAQLTIPAVTGGWTASLTDVDDVFQPIGASGARLDVTIAATQTKHMLVSLRPNANAPVGTQGTAQIQAVGRGFGLGCVVVRGTVSRQPKIYVVGIDALGPGYLALDRRGQINTASDTLLMPNVVDFLDDAARMVKAEASLPATTDPNILGAFTGSWSGTTGIPYVGVYFTGLTPTGELAYSGPSHDYLRWGATGAPVATIFDQAKNPSVGGNAAAFTATITGKGWMNDLLRDDQNTLDILADGETHPAYFSEPLPYKLGDPISDDDREMDRDGTNLDPENYKMVLETFNVGFDPVAYPEDRWIAQNALRMLMTEDPDVMFVHLTGVDEASHAAGSADKPEEWFDPNQTERLWDDFNIFNVRANRETLLDVVHEADASFGLLQNALRTKGTLDQSVMVLFSDHSSVTYVDEEVNIEAVLEDAGLDDAVIAGSWGETSAMFLQNPALVPDVERALENYTMYHPILKRDVRPFVAITRAEMASGIDNVVGRIAASTNPKRAELYSEWTIDYPVSNFSKVRWPDLVVLTGYRLQLQGSEGTSLPHPIGGHGGLTTKPVVLGIDGPGFATGTFDQRASLVDIAPTLYRNLGWDIPAHVDGRVLSELLNLPVFLPQVVNTK